jgi:hypothetical protein
MVLDKFVKEKRLFNEYNKKDLLAVKYFFQNKSWGPDCCPFVLVPPYLCVPDMVTEKLINKALKIDKEEV